MRSRLRLVRLLGLRWSRFHPLRSLLALVAVAGGVSMAMSVVVASSSISWSFAHFSAGVAGGAQLRVIGATARGGLEAQVAQRVAETPGVGGSYPVVQAVTSLDVGARHTEVLVLGIGDAPRALSDRLVRQFASQMHLGAANRGLRGFTLATAAGPLPMDDFQVTQNLNSLAGGRVVIMPLAVGQALFARNGRLDAVYVSAARGVAPAGLENRLARVVGPQNAVVSAGSPPPEAAVVTQSFLPLLAMMALLAIGVSVVLIHDIVDLAFSERRRSMAVVAALGASPPAMSLPALEALLIGIAGGAAGIFGGWAAAAAIVATIGRIVHRLAGVPLSLHLSLGVAVAAPLVGLLLAVVAAAGPVRRTWSVSIADELVERGADVSAGRSLPVQRTVVTAGLVLVGLAGCWISSLHGSIASWQYPVGIGSFALLMAALTLCTGNLAPLSLAALRRLPAVPGRRDARWSLALSNLIRTPGRTGTMAVAVAAGVAVAFTAANFNHSTLRAIAGSRKIGEARWIYVSKGTTGSVSIDSEDRFSPAELAALAEVPGVAKVIRQVGIITGHDAGSVIGVETSDDLEVRRIQLVEGSASPSLLRRGQAVVGTALARRQHLRPGSQLVLDTPTGIARVTVAGIWKNGDFNGSSAFVSQGEMARLYGVQQPTNVYVDAAPGVSVGELAGRVSRAGIATELHAATPPQALAADMRSATAQVAPFWSLQRILMALSFVAVLSTLVLAGVQRQREYGALAAVGFSPGDLGRLVLAEGTVLGVAGAVLGGLMGVVGTVGLIAMIPLVIGYRDPLVLAPGYWAIYAAIGVAITAVASLLPAWRAAHIPVLDALHEE